MCRCSEGAGASCLRRSFLPQEGKTRFCQPRPEALPQAGEKDRPALLAFGGDLKAAFCLAAGDRAYLSQYFGDMENLRVHQTFRRELSRMEGLFGIRPETLVCDLHPGYLTTQLAQKLAEETCRPLLRVPAPSCPCGFRDGGARAGALHRRGP